MNTYILWWRQLIQAILPTVQSMFTSIVIKGFFLPCNSSFTLKPWFCDEIFSLLGFQASEKKSAKQNKRDTMLELYRFISLIFNYVIWVHQIISMSQKATHRRRLQWLKIPVFMRLGSTSFNSSDSSVWSPKTRFCRLLSR